MNVAQRSVNGLLKINKVQVVNVSLDFVDF